MTLSLNYFYFFSTIPINKHVTRKKQKLDMSTYLDIFPVPCGGSIVPTIGWCWSQQVSGEGRFGMRFQKLFLLTSRHSPPHITHITHLVWLVAMSGKMIVGLPCLAKWISQQTANLRPLSCPTGHSVIIICDCSREDDASVSVHSWKCYNEAKSRSRSDTMQLI